MRARNEMETTRQTHTQFSISMENPNFQTNQHQIILTFIKRHILPQPTNRFSPPQNHAISLFSLSLVSSLYRVGLVANFVFRFNLLSVENLINREKYLICAVFWYWIFFESMATLRNGEAIEEISYYSYSRGGFHSVALTFSLSHTYISFISLYNLFSCIYFYSLSFLNSASLALVDTQVI